MSQFYKWDCWWCNCFQTMAGCHYACFYCSLWLKKPLQAQKIDPGTCKCGQWTGIGDHCFWFGGVCCAPDYIGEFSEKLTEMKPKQQKQKKRLKQQKQPVDHNDNKGTEAQIHRQNKP